MSDDERHPVSTELTVLPADPQVKPLGWTCHERMGVEVHLYEEGREYSNETITSLEPITDEDALKAGTKILVHGMLGELYLMTVVADDHGQLYAQTEPGGLIGSLAFGEDDRNAWVCIGLINMRGIKKLELTTDG